MPKHPDFVQIYNHFIKQYGNEKGSNRYYAWLQENNLDDTISLSGQRFRINDAKIERANQIMSRVTSEFSLIKPEFEELIGSLVDRTFNDAIQAVSQELSIEANSLIDFNKVNAAKLVLKDNFKRVNFELFDAISKEISIFVTDYQLSGLPISNTKLKSEIKKLFSDKLARLESQVITETTRVAGTALNFGYEASGVITHKQWVAILDDRTTSICRDGNGEIVEIGKPFSDGLYSEPHHINCRSRTKGLTLSEQ